MHGNQQKQNTSPGVKSFKIRAISRPVFYIVRSKTLKPHTVIFIIRQSIRNYMPLLLFYSSPKHQNRILLFFFTVRRVICWALRLRRVVSPADLQNVITFKRVNTAGNGYQCVRFGAPSTLPALASAQRDQ